MHGRQFPCPAYLHCNGNFEVSRAMSCRIQGESVHPSVHPSTICPEPLSGCWGQGEDGRTDRQTHRFQTQARHRQRRLGHCFPALVRGCRRTRHHRRVSRPFRQRTISHRLLFSWREEKLVNNKNNNNASESGSLSMTMSKLPRQLGFTIHFMNNAKNSFFFIKSSVLYAYYCKCILNLYVKAMR